MTTTFDSRERSYENKFAHDQETEFKILARASYLLGLWAAGKIQLAVDAAEGYAQSIVEKVAQKDSKLSVKEQLHTDFSKAGIEIGIKDIEGEMEKFLHIAREQILNIG